MNAQRGHEFRLLVRSEWLETARAELASYDQENRDWPPPEEALPGRAPLALGGTVAYGVLLGALYLSERASLGGLDWIGLGGADAARIRAGELARATTALFLHTGPVHLFSNLLFGWLFGYLVAHAHGGGLGWLAILLSGTIGNLLNAWLQSPDHLSIGASTAVFGAVGILGGSEWRRRSLLRERRLRVAAPIVFALCILAFHGAPEEVGRVDVSAHVTGFVAGLGLGALLPALGSRGAERPGVQWLAAGAALGAVGAAWAVALTA